ncbi:PRC-barrel domain-containing protein [Maritimibacter alkaliphilus]|uniref:PRC-barrel domain-containing protein n=1 Tax=Maritimibacter alkaliphilus TaxID=404236 RepID=UPI001C93748D|nr:PRC-barrel domain-containing protein [Maritimibacter alkaliphilus]MBY6091557.1 PRC-barrel domain-containing protein [Maritimibacter alkaliphilus]
MTNVKAILLSGAAALALVSGPVAAQTADVTTDTEMSTDSADTSVTLQNQTAAEADDESLMDQAADATGDAIDATGEALEDGADAATDMAESAGESIEDGAEATADAADNAGDEISEEASELQQSAENSMESDTAVEADSSTDLAVTEDDTEMTPGDEMAGEEMANAVEVEAGSMVGTQVMSSAGEEIGEIDQFVRVDNDVMAVIGVGGFLGLGEHEVALPLSDLDVEGENVTAFGYTEEQLKSMAEYDKETAQAVEDSEIVSFGRS